MKRKKIRAAVLAGILLGTAIANTHVHASQEEIDAMSAYKQATEASLYATQSHIDSLAAKQQEMQNYLYELNSQYEQLTQEIENLSVEAGQKQEDLKGIQANLESAKAAAAKQYEGMKTRMAYMYENGSTSVLAMLLSSDNMADFLNRAENIRQISEYDQRMLQQYQKLQAEIETQEETAQQEIESINSLMQERASKQQEVESLVASTNDSIASYAYEISASQAEANALLSEIRSADAAISSLQIQQAAAEAAAAAAAQQAYEEQNSASEESYDYNTENSYEEPTYDSYESDDSNDSYQESYQETYQETYEDTSSYEETYEESYEDSYSESSSGSSSGQGTYLGTFTLTAYCNCASCCGSAGNLTASGTWPTAGRTVAMGGVPFGTQLLINGNVYTVEDRGTSYGHVDVYMDSHSAALQFGLQSAEVYQLN